MSRFTGVKCDRPGCNQIKGETNHWWSVYINSDRQYRSLTYNPWSSSCTPDGGFKDICSVECLTKMVQIHTNEVLNMPSGEPANDVNS